MHVGQRIAIDVLNRHIETSSGKCADEDIDNYSGNCVMADAIRDRFPNVENLDVSGTFAMFDTDGNYVDLVADDDMKAAINAFDETVESVRTGTLSVAEGIVELRNRIPRVVHGTVRQFSEL